MRCASSGVVASPVKAASRRRSISSPSSGPSSIPSSRASTSPRTAGLRLPRSRASRAPRPSARAPGRGAPRSPSSALRPRVASRSAQVSTVTSTSTGLGLRQVAVDRRARQRPLVDHEAEHEVVARDPAEVVAQRVAGPQPPADSWMMSSPARSWPMNVTRPSSRTPRVAGLPMSWKSAAKRSASPRVSSSPSGSSELARARAAPARRRTRARGRAPGRSAPAAPRACGRARRRGGSGSAPPRAGRRARAARRASIPSSSARSSPSSTRSASTSRRSSAKTRSGAASVTRGAAARVAPRVGPSGTRSSSVASRTSRSGAQRVALVGAVEHAQHAPLDVGQPALRVDRLAAARAARRSR